MGGGGPGGVGERRAPRWRRGALALVETSEDRTRCPKQVNRRFATGMFGDLDLALRAPTDRVLSAPAELSFADPTRHQVRSKLTKWPCLSVRQSETETGYTDIRPRKRARERPGCCPLRLCQRINEGASILGLQSTNLPLCRNQTPP